MMVLRSLRLLRRSAPAARRRRRSRPVALAQVVEAALGEVREHRRVDVLHVDALLVRGEVAGDLVRVLAELLDNATTSCPPRTTVQLAGEAASTGYVLQIEDHGGGAAALVLLPNECIMPEQTGSNREEDRTG
jgi:K+-sensing histidine kinase KdpD